MAIIGSIRKRSGLLIILIGVALVLFLLSDTLSNGGGSFTQEDQSIGMIAGQDIDQRDFEIRVQKLMDDQFGPDGGNEEARKRLRETVWQQMINEMVIAEQQGKLGIGVTRDELMDEVRDAKPGSVLYQYFTNPQTGQIYDELRDQRTGGLDQAKVIQVLQNLINSENSGNWLQIENAIRDDVAMNKYTMLVTKGLTATVAEAQQRFTEQNEAFNVDYVVKEYASLPDGEVEVPESEIKDYFNAHKDEARFQNDIETRNARFVVFEADASIEDINDIRAELEAMVERFEADSNDTAFVGENADSRIDVMIKYHREDILHPEVKDTLMNGEVGLVVGPYQQGTSMWISKLSGFKHTPDSVRASHILISVNDGDTAKISAAKAKLDSLKGVAESRNNFSELAETFSEDYGSAAKGGDLDWFGRGMMVGPFEAACFDGRVGDMPIVVSQFGVHLINITDQTELKKQYLLSTVDRTIEASKETRDHVYRLASSFASNNKTADKFEVATEIEGSMLGVQPADGLRMGDIQLGPVPDAEEAIRWVFSAEREIGDVSIPVIEMEDKFIVVALKEVMERGTMTLEAARPLIEPELIRNKKAEKFIADFGSYGSLQEAAQNVGEATQTADNLHFTDSSIPGGVGREPAMVGAVSTLEQGEVSKPIQGIRGVYVATVTQKTPAPDDINLEAEQQSASQSYNMRVNREMIDALKKAVGVEDDRARFY